MGCSKQHRGCAEVDAVLDSRGGGVSLAPKLNTGCNFAQDKAVQGPHRSAAPERVRGGGGGDRPFTSFRINFNLARKFNQVIQESHRETILVKILLY